MLIKSSLAGKNHIPAGRPGRRLFVVNPTHQIVVQQGDFLGFHYSVHSVAGVIDVQNVSRHANHSAPTTPQQTLQAGKAVICLTQNIWR